MTFNPKTEALAFRIWAYASRNGWNCTMAEIAEALDESKDRIRAIVVHRNWTNRLRVSSKPVGHRMGAGGSLIMEVDKQANDLRFEIEHGLTL